MEDVLKAGLKLLRGIRRLLADSRGAEIAELAAILPVLAMVIFGILWFGRAFQIYTTINHAARAAAEAAATRSCATCGNSVLDDNSIKDQVIKPIFDTARLDISQLVSSNYSVTPDVVSGPGAPVVEVTIRYPYMFRLNGFTCCPPALTPINLGITIHATAQVREEQ